MKTKFILHGGSSSRDTEDNRKFFLEIVNSVNANEVNILCIYFARLEHRWNESFEEDKTIFTSLRLEKHLNLDLATADKEILRKQISHSDVIFINGGVRGHLKKTLGDLGNFMELIRGKVVVGISAGANILAKYYYSSAADGIKEGLGVLPIKTFCHYTEQDDKGLEELDNYKEKLRIYRIPEDKFLIIEL